MTSRRQCPRVCVIVNVLFTPPPFQEILSPRLVCMNTMYTMYICMYVWYMYVCMYVCTHVCMYVCTYVCMYVCACVRACMYVCMYVRMYVCMGVCVRACVHACMYVYLYVCMYVCLYVCRYVRVKCNRPRSRSILPIMYDPHLSNLDEYIFATLYQDIATN